MRIDGRRNLLSSCLIRGLQNCVAQTERNGEVLLHTPGILDEVFKFIRLEMAIDKGTVIEQCPSRRAAYRVVVDVSDRRNRSYQICISDLVRVQETTVNRIQS